MKKIFQISVIMSVFILFFVSMAFGGGKILFVDSYHEGYAWSDGITRGIQSVLAGKDVELKVFRMDTKRNTGKNFIRKAAITAKAEIERFKPDVIIAADDNASKYLIKPFYKDASVPVVFCGINWDAAMYGYPYKNATGMVEVASIPRLLEYLRTFAKGSRVGYLAADVTTARKEGAYYRKLYNPDIDERYARNFPEWIRTYTDMQNKVDMLIVGNKAGINDWNDARAKQIVVTKTKIPTGTIYDFMENYALIGYVKIPEEQGEWSAETALKVLNGADIASIPLTENKKGNLIINREIEKALGITFSDDMIASANRVIQ